MNDPKQDVAVPTAPGAVSPALTGPGGAAAPPPPRPTLLVRLGVSGEQLLVCLLLELWLLNVADLLLTRYSIWLGFATESNGVMRYLLNEGALTAAVFKLGVVTIGGLLLWMMRRRPAALAAAALLVVLFGAVVGYQALWIASL
jgi:hypothetical protein